MNTKKIVLITSGITASIIVLVLLYFFNPMETPIAPRCPFKEYTGWSCPGCGMQRFLHALTHGRLLEAISYNFLLAILLPYMMLLILERFVLKGSIQRVIKRLVESNITTYSFCVIVALWTIVRNILNI